MDPILEVDRLHAGHRRRTDEGPRQGPRYKFSEGDKGRDEIMAYIQDRLPRSVRVLPRAFNTLVPGHLEVRRMSPEQEPGAPGAYGGAGSIDGKIPGKFWINLRTTDLHSKYSLPDLAAHEAIPGHVWQGEYANKLPLIRTLLAFNAYSEGWALYAEQLVDELGVYDDFPVGRSAIFSRSRSAAAVWSSTAGFTRSAGRASKASTSSSTQRLQPARSRKRGRSLLQLAGPGLRLQGRPQHHRRLRDKAKAELGPKYDLRAFDDAVVLGGNVPDGRPRQEHRRLYRPDESGLVERPCLQPVHRSRRAQPKQAKPAATSAATADAASRFGPTPTPNRWNATPTATAPVVWPSKRAVASIPPAAPERCRGAELTIVRLLGDWNRPKPMPHTAIRQTMSNVLGCSRVATA